MAKLANQAVTIKRFEPEANVLQRIVKADRSLNFTDAAKTLQLLSLFNGSFQVGHYLCLQSFRVLLPSFHPRNSFTVEYHRQPDLA